MISYDVFYRTNIYHGYIYVDMCAETECSTQQAAAYYIQPLEHSALSSLVVRVIGYTYR